MRNVVPKEGPRAPLFFSAASVVLLALLKSYSANAQTVDMSALERCSALETEELKLRCFEAIIASGETEVIEESPAPQSTPAASTAEQAKSTTDSAADDVVASGSVAGPAATPAAEAVSTDVATAEPTATTAASAPADVASEAENPGTTVTTNEDAFGLEHLAQPESEREKSDTLLRATVVEVSKGRNGILYFTLDNGQVWRQIEARHYSYPKNTEFEVNISRGMMREYRMRIGDNGSMVRIRRVK